MARAMAPPSWAVKLSSLNCSSWLTALGAATCPGAMLGAWGFLGRFMAVSSRDLLTCSARSQNISRKKKNKTTKKNNFFASFSQPTTWISCADHGNSGICL